MEYDLVLFYCPFVKDFTGDVFESKIDSFSFGLLLDTGEESHFKLESEDIYFCYSFLPAFRDDLFDKKSGNREIYRANSNKPVLLFSRVRMITILDKYDSNASKTCSSFYERTPRLLRRKLDESQNVSAMIA